MTSDYLIELPNAENGKLHGAVVTDVPSEAYLSKALDKWVETKVSPRVTIGAIRRLPIKGWSEDEHVDALDSLSILRWDQ